MLRAASKAVAVEGQFEEIQQLRRQCHLLEQDLSQAAVLAQSVAASRDKAESQSRRALSQLEEVRQSFAATLLQESEAASGKNAKNAVQEASLAGIRGPREVAHESMLLRDSLHALCKGLEESNEGTSKLAETGNKQAWLREVADVGGQVLSAMAALGELNQKLQRVHLEMHHPRETDAPGCRQVSIKDVADLDAKNQQGQAACAAGSLRLQAAASEQALLQEEAVCLQAQLRCAESCDSACARTCSRYAEELRGDADAFFEEVRNPAVVGDCFVHTDVFATKPVGPLLALVLQELARAQKWAVSSKWKSSTWKSLMQGLLKRDSQLEELHASRDDQPLQRATTLEYSSERASSASMADRSVGFLEAQLSDTSRQWHHSVSVCCKLDMDLRTLQSHLPAKKESAAKEAAASMLQQAKVWSHELMRRCAAWLSHSKDVSNWQDIAAVRELGLERSVRDLATINQAMREQIWSLEAEHENLNAAAFDRPSCALASPGRKGPSGLQQQVDSLKSELRTAREDLRNVKDRPEAVLQQPRAGPLVADDGRHTHTAETVARSGVAELAQICPALTAMARHMQRMCQETDTQRKSSAFQMVLDELGRTQSWCKQVQLGLRQQANMPAKLLSTSQSEPSTGPNLAHLEPTDMSREVVGSGSASNLRWPQTIRHEEKVLLNTELSSPSSL